MPPTLSLNDNFYVEDDELLPFLEEEAFLYAGFDDLLVPDDVLDRVLSLDNHSEVLVVSPITGKPSSLCNYDLIEEDGKITWMLKNRPDRLLRRARFYLQSSLKAWYKADRFPTLLPEIKDAVKCCIAHRRIILDAIWTSNSVNGLRKKLRPDSVTWCSRPKDSSRSKRKKARTGCGQYSTEEMQSP